MNRITAAGRRSQDARSSLPNWPSKLIKTPQSKHDAIHIFKPRVLFEDHYVLSNSSPADYDPFKNPQCNNLIHLQVSVNGGVVRDTDLNFYLDFLISD